MRRIAEHSLGTWVPNPNQAFAVGEDHGVRDMLDKCLAQIGLLVG